MLTGRLSQLSEHTLSPWKRSGLDVGIQVLQRMVPAMRQREKGASESEGETQSPLPSGRPKSDRGGPTSALSELLICFTSLLQAEIKDMSRTGA